MPLPTTIRLLRLFRFTSALTSLNARALAVCLLTLVALCACIIAILNNQFASQQAEKISQALKAEALAIQQGQKPIASSLTGTTPISFHAGGLAELRHATDWPSGCTPSADQRSEISYFKCAGGLRVHALAAGPEMTLWTTQQRSNPFFDMRLEDRAGLLALIVGISLLCSRWISQSITRPLAEITSRAQRMAQGNYDQQLPESPIVEINRLVNSFNHMARDLQERDRLIRRTAYKDQLTGLDNRAFLSLALRERTHAAREPLSIVVWGIDNLDSINEVLGHEVADKVLIKVARKARRICRENLAIARLEGNIFCMLLPRSLLDRAMEKHSLKRLLQGSLRVRNYQLEVQSHAGLAHYPDHGHCAETLLRRAEIARQLAKKTRQPGIEFETRLEARSTNRLELIAQLKRAISDEEFCLYFQPKLNLRTRSINQAEVLLRWNHPLKGLVSPGAFMELAEQTGMVRDITRLVLQQVYRIIDLCMEQDIKLSMNLSALDLDDFALAEFAAQLHQQHPEAAHHIAFEITESAAMRDPERALEVLNRLASMGFQIAVDDFGTGYSSLAYLKRFPVTELKIDRSLVQDADLDTDGQIILQSTIEMGHIMGLVVTTEGVETQAEFELVKKLGADYVQGFWLSRPMPFEEFRLKHLVGNHSPMVHPL